MLVYVACAYGPFLAGRDQFWRSVFVSPDQFLPWCHRRSGIPESNPLGILEPPQCFWYPRTGNSENSQENLASLCKITGEFGISMEEVPIVKYYARITSAMAPFCKITIQQALETLITVRLSAFCWKLL